MYVFAATRGDIYYATNKLGCDKSHLHFMESNFENKSHSVLFVEDFGTSLPNGFIDMNKHVN